jgi:putative DNA primase/helicase
MSGAAANQNRYGNYSIKAIADDFMGAIAAVGMPPPAELIADGRIHRFSANGKRGDDAGWYVLHADGFGPAGVFGDWRTGSHHTWNARLRNEPTPAGRDAWRQRASFAQVVREQEQRERQAKAAHAARVRWDAAVPIVGDGHPYLRAKGIQAHGVRVEGCHTLLVPMRNTDGKLHGLQSIAPDGAKRFTLGQRVSGLYHAIGKPGSKLLICEGYATGATLYQESGEAVAVAFSAGNLKAVAMALQSKNPALELVVCADDDWQTDGNPGLTNAREAAAAVGARLAVPDFSGLPRGDKDTDFNDLMRLHRQAKKGGAA